MRNQIQKRKVEPIPIYFNPPKNQKEWERRLVIASVPTDKRVFVGLSAFLYGLSHEIKTGLPKLFHYIQVNFVFQSSFLKSHKYFDAATKIVKRHRREGLSVKRAGQGGSEIHILYTVRFPIPEEIYDVSLYWDPAYEATLSESEPRPLPEDLAEDALREELEEKSKERGIEHENLVTDTEEIGLDDLEEGISQDKSQSSVSSMEELHRITGVFHYRRVLAERRELLAEQKEAPLSKEEQERVLELLKKEQEKQSKEIAGFSKGILRSIVELVRDLSESTVSVLKRLEVRAGIKTSWFRGDKSKRAQKAWVQDQFESLTITPFPSKPDLLLIRGRKGVVDVVVKIPINKEFFGKSGKALRKRAAWGVSRHFNILEVIVGSDLSDLSHYPGIDQAFMGKPKDFVGYLKKQQVDVVELMFTFADKATSEEDKHMVKDYIEASTGIRAVVVD